MDYDNGDASSEKDLLERFREGDGSAFDAIVRRHRLAVYRVARRVLGSHEDADEVAQETFVRAYRALAGFRGDAQLRTWLTRIALNVGRTIGAQRSRTAGLEEAREMTDGGAGAEEAAARAQARARVRDAVTLLPPRQREVVALKVFSDMTYEDVAAAMGLTTGAVKAHFHQAVRNLRRRVAGGEVPR